MMKPWIILFFVCVCSVMHAQDTIYKRSGELISAKISEISSVEIKYKRFTMLDGPLFIIARDEVKKIKFSNGAVDSFVVSSPVVVQPVVTEPLQPTISFDARPAPQKGLIRNPRPGTYYFNEVRINEKKMLMIATDKNRTWKNKELDKAIMATRDYKSNQYISGFGGAGIAIIALIATSQSAQNNANTNVSAAIGFNAIGIFIASQIITPMFKRKRALSARKVVELYNQQL